MVGMALLRNSNTTEKEYSATQQSSRYISDTSGDIKPEFSQYHRVAEHADSDKLGQNIDVVLASQFLTNLLEKLPKNHQLRERINKALNVCVVKIQKGQMADEHARRRLGRCVAILTYE